MVRKKGADENINATISNMARGIMKKLSQEKMIDTILSKRKALGLTQASLSEKTGINRVMIGRIENK